MKKKVIIGIIASVLIIVVVFYLSKDQNQIISLDESCGGKWQKILVSDGDKKTGDEKDMMRDMYDFPDWYKKDQNKANKILKLDNK